MPIKPEEIDPSKLQVTLRGYDREATDELLKRVAWDYRQALRGQEDRSESETRLRAQIEELEARVAAQNEEFASLLAARESRAATDTSSRVAALEAELAVLQRKLHVHESRSELTRMILQAAQRAAREVRESAKEDARALLKAARRRANQIERDAHSSARHSAIEIERLNRLESDLRERQSSTLESVIGKDAAEPSPELSPSSE